MIAWGAAVRPLAGETACGDAYVVHHTDDGAIVAAIDGLGHGAEAAAAAAAATEALGAGRDEPVDRLFQRCHAALRATRGAALTVARFAGGAMSWSGVGNVEGWLVRANPGTGRDREVVLQRGGVVGYALPTIRVGTVPVAFGDTLILATDGVRLRYGEVQILGVEPQVLADALLTRFAVPTDDALVVVARVAR